MGRKTLEALGKPLANRTNIIISHNHDFKADSVIVVHALEDAITEAQKANQLAQQAPEHRLSDEIFVIGGAEIYTMALPLATTLYLTEIHQTYDGDAYFPQFDKQMWQEVSRWPHPVDDRHAVAFDFVEYKRVK